MRTIKVCLQDSATDEEVETLIAWLQGVRCTGAVYETTEQASQQLRALDGAAVCRQVSHFYVDGICAECGSPEPPRQ